MGSSTSGGGGASSAAHGLARAVLRVAAGLVPHMDRRSWRDEWEGELWALERRGWSGRRLLAFALDGARCAAALRREEMMTGWVDDVRIGVRGLLRSPGFTAVAVLVMALGVGATTSIFSVLHAALIRGAPHPGAEELVMVDLLMGPRERARAGDAGEGVSRLPFSWPRFEVMAGSLERVEMAGFARRDMTLVGTGDAARVTVEIVSANYFDVLRATPALGRTFRPDETPPAEAPVAVLSHAAWRDRFGGDPAVLGRTLRVNEATATVVGVMPADFDGLTGDVDLWIPMTLAPRVMEPRKLERVWNFWFHAVGRVSPGTASELAAAEVARAGRVQDDAFGSGGDSGTGATLTPFLEARVNPEARLSVLVLAGASLLLLLIACANVAGLLAARATTKRPELAVRAALGAGRARLVRGHLVESLAVALLGGAAGVALSWWGVRVLAAWLPQAVGMTGSHRLRFLDPGAIGIHGPVLLFALAASVVTGVVAGAWPALGSSRASLARSMAGTRSVAGPGGRAAGRARSVLVSAQLAIALVLLAGTGLMLSSLARLNAVELGFEPEGVLVGRYELPRSVEPDEVAAFHATLEERLAGLPGVDHAAVATCAPLSGSCDVVTVNGRDGLELPGEEQAPVSLHVVGDAYFDALEIPVTAGRAFDARDGAEEPFSLVLGREAARQLFPGEDPIGRRLAVSFGPLSGGEGGVVVGVVGDAQHDAVVTPEVMPAVYASSRQVPVEYMSVVVASPRDPAELARAVRAEVAALRPDVPLYDVGTLQARVGEVTGRTRVVLALLAAFAVVAVLLSAVGLYGLMAFEVSRRVREMGVRMALGAGPGRVVGQVLGRTVVLVAGGCGVGLAGAWVLTRLMEGLLYDVGARDPRSLAGAAVVLALTALLAAWLPARRAAAVDPATSLRLE